MRNVSGNVTTWKSGKLDESFRNRSFSGFTVESPSHLLRVFRSSPSTVVIRRVMDSRFFNSGASVIVLFS